MVSSVLQYNILNYGHTRYLGSVLQGMEDANQELVSFLIQDDGSPKHVQDEVTQMVSQHPGVQAVLHSENRGTIAMLNHCLKNSGSRYIHIAGGDDAFCLEALQNVLLSLKANGGMPLVVSDFYVVNVNKRSSVYVEAILPRHRMMGNEIPPEELKKMRREEQMYVASHVALAPTKVLLAAGGYPEKMKWHCDWFSFHVTALRAGIRYLPTPIACWRQSDAGYSHAARSDNREEREVLRQILTTLIKPEYADVRDVILSPNVMPLLDNIACQTLWAICSRPKYWRFLRWGHLCHALYEIAESWISPGRWGGKLVRWLEEGSVGQLLGFLRQPVIRLLLKLGGARVGRKVCFGKQFSIRGLRGLRIGDHVTIGDGVCFCAMHPLSIGSGTRIGDRARLESVNFSKQSGTRFLRKKSIRIGENVVIGADCVIGPGADIASDAQIPPGEQVENVESNPLFFLDEADQIQVDRRVLREWYGLGPKKKSIDCCVAGASLEGGARPV